METNPPTEPEIQETNAAKCRLLNDNLRRHFIGGEIVMTSGVNALGQPFVIEVVAAIRKFDNFNRDNDPHAEHDFGEVVVEGRRICFKIDVYDNDLQYGSPDPTDPDVTTRVMTILLPEEY